MDVIRPEIFFDYGVLQCGSAKWRETQPSRHETECLAEMTGIKKHHPIRAT
jgi:hypothetical protein